VSLQIVALCKAFLAFQAHVLPAYYLGYFGRRMGYFRRRMGYFRRRMGYFRRRMGYFRRRMGYFRRRMGYIRRNKAYILSWRSMFTSLLHMSSTYILVAKALVTIQTISAIILIGIIIVMVYF
jgi:hypothetical protein